MEEIHAGFCHSLFTNGMDMVQASNILGVDVMTGHWEFTFGEKQFLDNLLKFNGEFVANNVFQMMKQYLMIFRHIMMKITIRSHIQ